jgi:threonine/homoserine/homoserine lactone efflux protein
MGYHAVRRLPLTLQNLIAFLGASLLLTVAPGPDNTFVVAQGISRGRRAAVITALGMCSGVSVHTTAAALGISALLYASGTAFAVLKWLGAAYLLHLAWKALREGDLALPQADAADLPPWRLFRRGFFMNVVNPKVGLFFLAFLPQFVSPGAGSPAFQMFALGLLFMAQGVAVFVAIAFLAGTVGDTLRKRPRLSRWFNRLTAGVLATLAVRLALARK